jgi:hypothetical protein
MRFWTAAVFAALAVLPAHAQSNVTGQQARFERETDPVHKANILAKLGGAEMGLILSAAAENNYEGALSLFQQYRDQVNTAYNLLQSSGIDAERKPSGFKELQISLRRNIIRLRDVILSFPSSEQAPFEDVEQDLERIDRELINQLFPRQPSNPHAALGAPPPFPHVPPPAVPPKEP